MSIITVVNQKGGTGKSTIAINLAGYFARKKKSVFIMDADPQESITHWFKFRKEDSPLKIKAADSYFTKPELKNHFITLKKEYDFLIIDTPPEDDEISRICLSLADYLIVPITPSPMDIRSTGHTIEVIHEGIKGKAVTGNVRLLVSRKVPGTVIGREIKKALEKNLNFPAFKTEICQRIHITEAGIDGRTIFEYAPESKAAKEFELLGKEILKWIKN